MRGLAVIAVLLYHFFGQVFQGGYIGVDIFFVLSGFLITALLIREYATTGKISLKRFWTRRARRILPAALTVLIVTNAVLLYVSGEAAVRLKSQSLGILAFASNWVQIGQAQSYFSRDAVQVYAHYWSLSVEEQFYILWPLIVVGAFAVGVGRHARIATTLAAAAASAALMAVLYQAGGDPTRVYYGTDTHAFGLLIGATLALWTTASSPSSIVDTWPPRLSIAYKKTFVAVTSVVALMVIIAAIVYLPDQTALPYRGGLALISLMTALIILSLIHNVGPLPSLFNLALLRWFGKISYSLYLWHWPVIVIILALLRDSRSLPSFLPGVLAASISIPLASLSYKYVEEPIRRHGFKAVARQFNEHISLPRSMPLPQVSATLVTVVLSMSLVAVFLSPSQTALQTRLEAIAAVPLATPPPAKEPRKDQVATRVFPHGSEITAIGDSVMLASRPSLETAFPGVYVDAAVSRHWSAGLEIIRQMKAAHTLNSFVVLGFGTNGAAFPGQLDTIIKEIGPHRVIILVDPAGPRDWMNFASKQIHEAASHRKNVYVAHWRSYAQHNAQNLAVDDIHPQAAAATYAYANRVRRALMRWVKGSPSAQVHPLGSRP